MLGFHQRSRAFPYALLEIYGFFDDDDLSEKDQGEGFPDQNSDKIKNRCFNIGDLEKGRDDV